jgi:hypothetical protein
MSRVVTMENQELFSALRKVFNTTEYNRGRLGEAVKAHEGADHGNWYFVQSSKGITTAIIPVNELEELVKARDYLERLYDMLAHKMGEERLGDSDKLIDFVEAMEQLDVDEAEVRELVDQVEFE